MHTILTISALTMATTFKVIYRAVKKTDEMEIKAFSKYDAKRRFQNAYPQYEVIMVKEVDDYGSKTNDS